MGKAQFVDPLKVDPTRIDFGEVSNSSSASQKILVTRGDGGPVQPKVRPIRARGLEAQLHEIEPGERYELEVKTSPPFQSDRVAVTLELESGIPETPITPVPVSARIVPRVAPHPESLRIPRKRESAWEQSVRLKWDDDAPHRILGASVSDPGMQVRVAEKDGAQHVILEVPAEYRPKPGPCRVTIETNDPKVPVVTVPVTIEKKIKSIESKRHRQGMRRIPGRSAGKPTPGSTRRTKPKKP